MNTQKIDYKIPHKALNEGKLYSKINSLDYRARTHTASQLECEDAQIKFMKDQKSEGETLLLVAIS